MAVAKNPQKATLEKINQLFAYRRITDLLKESGLDKNKPFVDTIIKVQFNIYMLDSYLESQWDLQKKQFKILWKGIYDSLVVMGYKEKEIDHLTKEIRQYEKIERNCRKDQWPTKESMKEFYTTKSCDVRLIRHLIYAAHPPLQEIWKEKSWKYYDLITEVNDDIADVYEDKDTYNGNRFLISLLRKGPDKTRAEYLEYLAKVTSKAAEYFNERMDAGKNKLLAGWIATRSKETAKLLEKNSQPKIVIQLSSALLLAEMK